MIPGDAASPAANGYNLELIGARVLHDKSRNDLSTWLGNLNTSLNLQGRIQNTFIIKFISLIYACDIGNRGQKANNKYQYKPWTRLRERLGYALSKKKREPKFQGILHTVLNLILRMGKN